MLSIVYGITCLIAMPIMGRIMQWEDKKHPADTTGKAFNTVAGIVYGLMWPIMAIIVVIVLFFRTRVWAKIGNGIARIITGA
jgi:hypothetical protein